MALMGWKFQEVSTECFSKGSFNKGILIYYDLVNCGIYRGRTWLYRLFY